MKNINTSHTLIINTEKDLPKFGIICAHPDRSARIAREYLTNMETHTDYRGYQVYCGIYKNQQIFVGNTGIGAPAAAFLIEELSSMGVERIVRLGSNDGEFDGFCLKTH